MANKKQSEVIITNNTQPINLAIDMEVAKQNEIVNLYQSEIGLNSSKKVLAYVATFAVLMVSIALIWWLLTKSPSITEVKPLTDKTAPTVGIDKTSSALHQRKIKQLSEKVNTEEKDLHEVTTNYTVFSNVITHTGEIVVTGKSYRPNDTADKPYQEDCYHKVNNDSLNRKVRLLIQKKGGEVIYKEDDKEYLQFLEYCKMAKT